MIIAILNTCEGCGACSVICPEVFNINKSKATIDENKVEMFEDLCIDAALTCPTNSIEIIDY